MPRQQRIFIGLVAPQRKPLRILGIPSSVTEVQDILKAWVVISVIFAILRSRSVLGANFFAMLFTTGFVREIAIAGTTVGIGFLLHELAHKVVAQRFGCAAEFRSDDMMLLLALALSIFLGFVFIAPGATMIAGRVTRRQAGQIAVAGPWTNLVIAGAFALLAVVPLPVVSEMAGIGYLINVWLAVFNLIPFWILDGKKIWDWSAGVWTATLLLAIVMMFSPWPHTAGLF